MNNSNNVTTQSIPHLQPTDLARKWKRQHPTQTNEETTSIDSIHNTSNQSTSPKPEKHNASTKTTNPRHPLQLNSSPSISPNKQSTIYIQTALFDHPMDDHETKTEQPLHQQPTHQQLNTIQILSHTQTKQFDIICTLRTQLQQERNQKITNERQSIDASAAIEKQIATAFKTLQEKDTLIEQLQISFTRK